MDGIYALLARSSLCMPFDPTIEVTGIDVKSCFVFNSNALPLRLAFNNLDPSGTTVSLMRWKITGQFFDVNDDYNDEVNDEIFDAARYV